MASDKPEGAGKPSGRPVISSVEVFDDFLFLLVWRCINREAVGKGERLAALGLRLRGEEGEDGLGIVLVVLVLALFPPRIPVTRPPLLLVVRVLAFRT